MAFFGRRKSKEMKAEKILRVAVASPVDLREPRDTQDYTNAMVLSQVFDTPYRATEAGKDPAPVAFDGPLRAEPSRDDRPVFSAALKSGLVFSDGTPLSTELAARGLQSSRMFRALAEARAEGDRLIFVLRQPNARFDVALSQVFASLVLERDDGLIGTGPYQFGESPEPNSWRLVRNPHHPGDAPIDEIRFVCYPLGDDGKPQALIDAINRGEVDFTDALSRDDLKEVSDMRKSFQPGRSTAILHFNCRKQALDDARVRRALAMSIDRAAIARLSYENALAFTATSVLPPIMGSWNDGIRHHPAQAREDLAAIGVELPERLRMLTVWGPRAYLPRPANTANVVAQHLAELGIAVETTAARDASEFYLLGASQEFDLVLGGWIADTPDPVDFLDAVVTTSGIPVSGQSPVVRNNHSHYSSPEIDEAVAACRREGNPDRVDQVMARVAEETPLLALMYGPTVAVHSWRLRNFEASPVGHPVFADMDVVD